MSTYIPKKVKIGGHMVKVLYPYQFNDMFTGSGTCNYEEGIIKIKEAGITDEQTLWHEILHMVDIVYNGEKLDEDSISRLSEGIYQVIKDNFIIKPRG